jgi:hypothetical protein
LTIVACAAGAGLLYFGGLSAAIRVGRQRVEEEAERAGGVRV